MLEIINGEGIALELGDDTRIVVERSNPLFQESEGFFQDHTFPAKAPMSPTNKRFVMNGHLVEADNIVYELPATVLYGGRRLFVGLFRYKILDHEISFTLYVNWGEVAELAKTTKLTDFDFGDGDVYGQYVVPLEAQDTLDHPENYHYAYFPVMHRDYPTGEGTGAKIDFFANPWSYDNQAFEPWTPTLPIPPGLVWQRRWCPHFKLSYVLKRALEFLGYTHSGPIWNDPEFDKIYIHTEKNHFPFRLSANNYLPAIAIADFIKQIEDRLQLLFYFNSEEKSVYVSSFSSLLGQESVQDISLHVSDVRDISVAEKKGYEVELTPFGSDELFYPEGGQATAAYRLVVGSGENAVRLDVTTLHQKEEPAGYTYPVNGVERRSLVFGGGPLRSLRFDDTNAWPVRLLRYHGMKLVEAGKYWPEATSLDLTIDDAAYYQFLNDSKLIKISGVMPASLLSALDASQKISLRSNEGHSFMAMPRSISYSLASDAAELIDFEIEAYSIKKDEQTAARLEPVRPYFDERGEMAMQVKFVFNEQVYDAIEFEAYQAGSVNPLYRPARIMGEITESTAAPYYTTGSVAYVYSDAEDPGYHGLTILVPNTYPKPDPHRLFRKNY